eukprot:1295387-Prymnesium_polylepis.1
MATVRWPCTNPSADLRRATVDVLSSSRCPRLRRHSDIGGEHKCIMPYRLRACAAYRPAATDKLPGCRRFRVRP